MSERQELLFEGTSRREATALCEYLATQGIEAVVADWASTVGRWPVATSGRIVVLVAARDLDAARELYCHWQEQQSRYTASEDEMPPVAVFEAWSLCHGCGAKRLTRCPICRTESDDFPAAELPAELVSADPAEESVASTTALVCSMCDEPFEPRWMRVCPACGHDHGEGWASSMQSEPIESLNGRILFALVAMGALALLVFGYFAWII